jgi:hypothetical protein
MQKKKLLRKEKGMVKEKGLGEKRRRSVCFLAKRGGF